MKLIALCICSILLSLAVNSCKAQVVLDTPGPKHKRALWPPDDSLYYVAAEDSAKLTHVKNQFYRDKKGRLFDKMDAPLQADNIDAGLVTFFRLTDQDIDPLTFETIDGSWYARDKRFVYEYRPNDSGMICIKMENADVRHFKLLSDNSGQYGADRKHVFEETDIIKHLNPLNMRVITDKEGHLLKIISGQYIFDGTSGVHEAVIIKPAKARTKRTKK